MQPEEKEKEKENENENENGNEKEKEKEWLKILEVGCGNGWLSNRLASIDQCMVMGMDINLAELAQAQRVFGQKENLRFRYGDFSKQHQLYKDFDFVIFSASIQYFKDPEEIIRKALACLNENGEIHINDSFFYPDHLVMNARQRSKEYFSQMGFDEMQSWYFHHSIDKLRDFNYQLLYDPSNLINRIFSSGPFPWIMIKKNTCC
jgi:ubiquinone/menaquinone biosynthesis C-methylase UbiE